MSCLSIAPGSGFGADDGVVPHLGRASCPLVSELELFVLGGSDRTASPGGVCSVRERHFATATTAYPIVKVAISAHRRGTSSVATASSAKPTRSSESAR